MSYVTKEFRFLEIRFTDLAGKLRSIAIPLTKPCSTVEEVEQDPSFEKGTSIDGSSVIGFADVENSDLYLVPDKGTAYELPYSENRVACHCTIYQRSQESNTENVFRGDPRTLLKEHLKEILGENRTMKIKPEPEFYIFDKDQTFDDGGYADTYPLDQATHLMDEFALAMLQVGIQPKEIHHENGPSQQEIEIKNTEVLENADNLVKFKNFTKAIADLNGLQVTYMPKPFTDECGSGLHFHIQIWEKDKNLFGTERGEISEFAKQFIQGLLEHADALTAILNPSNNSYKRLVPGYEAPVYKCWGYRNRTTLIRVPLFRKSEKAAIEIRSADSTCNPYLALTAILLAGMDGVKKELEAPEPIVENVYELSEKKKREYDIGSLPKNLGDALESLKEDKVLCDGLGSLIQRFITLKSKEWEEYVNKVITIYDFDRYFNC